MILVEFVCCCVVVGILNGKIGICIFFNCDFVFGVRQGEIIVCMVEIMW